MAIVPRLEQYLREQQVEYTHHTHPPTYTARETARAEHIPEHRFAKAVVFSSEEGYAMAVLPADYVVDLQELRAALGLQRVRLATEAELAELFADCELGAMPPLGNLYQMPTYLESSLLEEEVIGFHAGTHRDVVYMRMADFRRLTEPVILHFARLAGA